ncbi:choice-of-anchor H family protein [Thalassotalea atypica]|uniref:choice-of-anchor H family protein n=1 Tax=Thalassotalea atypica TaxID=2054316 RepID=UPI0025745625|nr:choice-of-anchor H family protein [Thalassotalea atypica]
MKPLNKVRRYKKSEYGLASLMLEKCIYCIVVLIFLAVFSNKVLAQEVQSSTLSQGQYKLDELSRQAMANDLKQKTLDNDNKIKQPYARISRLQKIAAKEAQHTSSKTINSPIAKDSFHEFVIYSAATKLLEDDDGDGYYNTFGVLFDADVLSAMPDRPADVYAEIYLSQDGGPWFHLYTTDVFGIYGDSTEDEYEVITHLSENYHPDHYNVLIDLYEPGYSGIVATYSSDDSDLLYALPLESQDYEYIEEYHDDHGHGGSPSVLGLIILIAFLLIRRASSFRQKAF